MNKRINYTFWSDFSLQSYTFWSDFSLQSYTFWSDFPNVAVNYSVFH